MNAPLQQKGLADLIAQFAHWINAVSQRFTEIHSQEDLPRLEQELRDGGREILRHTLEHLLQENIDRQQEQGRTCPQCRRRRRHQGVRPLQLRTILGELRLSNVYWKCPSCGLCGHGAQAVAADTFSRLMRGLTCLLGTSLTSFHKAELVARRVLGVPIDDETIRQQCLREGHGATRQADALPEPASRKEPLVDSCDGTMVPTRQSGWREVKAYRFDHEGGRHGGADVRLLERRMKQALQAPL